VSDWNERALARRNARQAPAVSEVTPVRSTKNTRKFCRGKVGVEHKLVVSDRGSIGKGIQVQDFDKKWLVRYCSACGKETDWWYPMGILRREPPAWVIEHLRETF
jgi:hypothetical protein